MSDGLKIVPKPAERQAAPLTEQVRRHLLDGALDLIRRSSSPHAHLHRCATCPDYLVCTQHPRDACPVPNDWQCVACGMDSQDRWMDEQEPR